MTGRHRKAHAGMTTRQKQILRAGAVAAPLAAGLMLAGTTNASAKPLDINIFNGKPLVDLRTPGFTIDAESPEPGPLVGGRVGYTPEGGFQAEGRLGVKADASYEQFNAGAGRFEGYGGYSGQRGFYGGARGALGPYANVQDPLNANGAGVSAQITADEGYSQNEGAYAEMGGSAEVQAHVPGAMESISDSFQIPRVTGIYGTGGSIPTPSAQNQQEIIHSLDGIANVLAGDNQQAPPQVSGGGFQNAPLQSNAPFGIPPLQGNSGGGSGGTSVQDQNQQQIDQTLGGITDTLGLGGQPQQNYNDGGGSSFNNGGGYDGGGGGS